MLFCRKFRELQKRVRAKRAYLQYFPRYLRKTGDGMKKMTLCCVPICGNKSGDGYSMRRFPRDPKRRMLWIRNINRKNWEPNEYSCICDAHFSPEMWEKPRVDGKKKLKASAIPTIFLSYPQSRTKHENHHNALTSPEMWKEPCVDDKKQLKASNIPTISPKTKPLDIESNLKKSPHAFQILSAKQLKTLFKSQELNKLNCLIQRDSSKIQQKKIQNNNEEVVDSNDIFIRTRTEDPIPIKMATALIRIEELEKKVKKRDEKLEMANKILNRVERSKKNLLKRYLKMKRRCHALSAINSRNPDDPLSEFFNDDQIEWLFNRKRRPLYKWSEETIKKALRLRMICSEKGYEELLRQKFPLPSLRTLRRNHKSVDFSATCDDVEAASRNEEEEADSDYYLLEFQESGE